MIRQTKGLKNADYIEKTDRHLWVARYITLKDPVPYDQNTVRAIQTSVCARSHRIRSCANFCNKSVACCTVNVRGDYRIRMDGWMTCDFTSFFTVFQSYQDNVWMIMKGCVQCNSVYG